jgi:hypothetical protein
MDASLRLDDTSYTADATIRMADETPAQCSTRSASGASKATSKDPLPVVLKAALAHVERADKADKSAADHRTSAGMRFKELKDRVSSGEAGKGVSWATYCAKHLPTLTQRTVERYIAIAEGKASNVGEGGGGATADQSSPAEEEAMRRAKFQRAMDGARDRHRADGAKFDPETAYAFWRMDPHTGTQPDSPYARAAWNAMCDDFNKGRGKVWDGVTDAPYHIWRVARRFPDDFKSRAMWDRGDVEGNRDDGVGISVADVIAKSSAKSHPKRDPEARREQNAKAQANRRAKSSSIREANGGKASKPRQDRETIEQYQKLASLAKVLDAGQLQIINEIIEERWPGTEEKARAAKAQRDKAGE